MPAERTDSAHCDSGFVAHDGIRPVLTVDFNAQKGDGTMWAKRGDWIMRVGQPVILTDHDDLVSDGVVVEVAPLNWHGKPVFECVVVRPIGEFREVVRG